MVVPGEHYKDGKPVEVEQLRKDFVIKIAEGNLSEVDYCRLYDMVKYLCRDGAKKVLDGRPDIAKGYDYAFLFTYGHWPWESEKKKEVSVSMSIFLV